ncbi:hypothetical protein AB0M48_35590 [Lentzea sp. NPDC051208]
MEPSVTEVAVTTFLAAPNVLGWTGERCQLVHHFREWLPGVDLDDGR